MASPCSSGTRISCRKAKGPPVPKGRVLGWWSWDHPPEKKRLILLERGTGLKEWLDLMYYLEHFDLLFGQSSLEVLPGFAQPVDEESNHDEEDNHSWRSNNPVVNMVVGQSRRSCCQVSFSVSFQWPSDHERTGIKSVQNSKSLSPCLGTKLKAWKVLVLLLLNQCNQKRMLFKIEIVHM